MLVGSARHAAASVHLLYFRATAGNNSILVEWETATEQGIVAFNLYRSEDSGSKGQQIGDTFPSKGDDITGAEYSYLDTDVVPGVRYLFIGGGRFVGRPARSSPGPTPGSVQCVGFIFPWW